MYYVKLVQWDVNQLCLTLPLICFTQWQIQWSYQDHSTPFTVFKHTSSIMIQTFLYVMLCPDFSKEGLLDSRVQATVRESKKDSSLTPWTLWPIETLGTTNAGL
jgi:hypothetical protein